MRRLSRKRFSMIMGDGFRGGNLTDCHISKSRIRVACFDERSERYLNLVEAFQDEDLWISEWLYCQRAHKPFEYVEVDACGDETIIRITKGEEFYDFLMQIMKERACGEGKYRYSI